jgi:hypothetical protein
MAGTWRVVVKGALLCGLAGPTLSVVVFALGALLGSGQSGVRPGESRLLAMLGGVAIYWVHAIVVFSPLAERSVRSGHG